MWKWKWKASQGSRTGTPFISSDTPNQLLPLSANTHIQICKNKYKNANTQIQIHKYKYTKTNAQMYTYTPFISSDLPNQLLLLFVWCNRTLFGKYRAETQKCGRQRTLRMRRMRRGQTQEKKKKSVFYLSVESYLAHIGRWYSNIRIRVEMVSFDPL